MSDPFALDDLDGDPPLASPTALERPPYLDGLNEAQLAAVLAQDGPVLVLAGAGTGKTRTLTTRLAHILVEGRARPFEILAVTFTNKAAREMRERVARITEGDVEGWWIGTFHALGARILRENAEAAGLRSNFTILDADDQVRLLKQIAAENGIENRDHAPRALMAVIQRWKDRGLAPDKVTDQEGADFADGVALRLYRLYQERLRALNAADFGDLLLLCLALFRDRPEVLARYHHRFRYILVDEYQDTNVAQYLWLRLLAQGHRNICCVGDDDQSIYSWRGAEVGNILRFEDDFPGAKVVRLERNYRSTGHILAAASALIAHNEGRHPKTLWTEDDPGHKVRVRGTWDGEEEARAIGEDIALLQSRGVSLGEMAILVRAGFQTREFEERLMTLGLPYRVVGGLRFYERQESRDAIAYLRVLVQPDDDLAFERIVNLPKRGIGPAALQPVHMLARAQGISMTAALARLLETDELKPKPRAVLARLLDDFDRWRRALATKRHSEVAAMVLEESGYVEMWRADRSAEAPGRVENLKELVAALDDFDDLEAFLEHVSLVMDNDQSAIGDKVSLMTLHGAKGLEFDVVFLPGWEDGLFPHQKAMDEGGAAGLEEERRLAYVGLTRARRLAVVSFAASRRVFNQWQSALPSRFIDELPTAHVERAQTGAGGGVYRTRAESRPARPGLAEAPRPAWNRPAREATGFDLGERVFHQKFGYGRIFAIDGEKFEIAFDKAGVKKVLAGFVEKT